MKSTMKIILLGVLVTGAGCTYNEPANLPAPGHYDRTTVSTNSQGTTVSNQKSTDVTVDADGNKTAVIKNSNSTDPEGLLNRRSNTNTTIIHEQ